MTKSLYNLEQFFSDNPYHWYTRREIARELGRAGCVLRNSDCDALEALTESGVIEVRTMQNVRGGKRFEYHKVTRGITER